MKKLGLQTTTLTEPAPNSGTSSPKTLEKYNELVACYNQLQEALTEIWDRKDHYKNESVSLSGSLTDNVEELRKANCIIKVEERNDIAKSVGLKKDIILRAASTNQGPPAHMTSHATVPSFSAEDNTNARVWFSNLLKFKDSVLGMINNQPFWPTCFS